jgi:hypothetical protein
MSSTASPAPEDDSREPPFRSGFEPRLAGARAECDGGAPVVGTHLAGRQDFTGKLTGHYRDFGAYPWRWYLMAELEKKPAGYDLEAVWCDSGNLTILDQDKQSIPLAP